MEKELNSLCKVVKKMIINKEYEKVEKKIIEMIEKYPHSPVPHNLLGLLLEKENNHVLAMKHFRAAYALDPTYIPCKYNMQQYSKMYPTGEFAYCEEDCKEEEDDKYVMQYDMYHIGHVKHK